MELTKLSGIFSWSFVCIDFTFLSEGLAKYCLTGWQNIQVNINGMGILFKQQSLRSQSSITCSDFGQILLNRL
jgi:hypothetical protein